MQLVIVQLCKNATWAGTKKELNLEGPLVLAGHSRGGGGEGGGGLLRLNKIPFYQSMFVQPLPAPTSAAQSAQ